MSQRVWDRLGAAAGPIGVLLALAGLAATGATGNVIARPARDAAMQEVVSYMSRPASAISSIGFACVLTGFFLILVFAARLRASLKSAAGGLDWLATAGLAGMVFYLSADIARFMFSDARNLAVGHHVQPAESVAFFDISNALTPVAWAGIAMFLIPSSLSAVRSRALPAWLAWVGLAIGVCQLGLGLVAARRYIDAGRRRLHPLVGSDRFSSRLARPGCDWRAQLKVVPVRTDDR